MQKANQGKGIYYHFSSPAQEDRFRTPFRASFSQLTARNLSGNNFYTTFGCEKYTGYQVYKFASSKYHVSQDERSSFTTIITTKCLGLPVSGKPREQCTPLRS